ncbi:MAG: lysophospholipid acyltransferase family protein [Balneolaceae bacterium]
MSKILFSVYVWACFVLLFAFFFVPISIVYLITFLFDRYKRIPNYVLAKMAWCMLKVSPGWKIEIQGVEKFDTTKPTIFIANHESFLDIPLLYQLPWRMKWVVKHSMTYIPVMGWMVKLTGQLTINRSSKSALKKLSNLVKPLKDLVPVMIFPEGTRSLDGKVKSFKNGAFLMALEHGFRLQPIVIDGAHEVLNSGSKLFNTKGILKLSVLDCIDPKDFKNMSDLKSYARTAILNEQERLENY